MSPIEFYQLTPAEFHYALKEYKEKQWRPSKNICETIRMLSVIVHNSAFGRKKKDMIRNPKHLFPFAWETVSKQRQSVKQMKDTLLAIHFMYGKTKKNKPEC